MRLWFWGWSIAAVAIAAVSAGFRDRASAPFAVGAACAAGLEAAGVGPAFQWLAFAGVSAAVFVAVMRLRYTPRHAVRGPGLHRETSAEHEDRTPAEHESDPSAA